MNFLNPYAALYGLALIPIVLFYFLKQERLALDVSSLIPWLELSEAPTSERRRLKLEILLLLQLLIILSLVLALIRFYLLVTKEVNHQVFIMDASASMQTREEGGSRLALAKAHALKLIEASGDQEYIMLIRAGAHPKRLTGFTNDRTELEQAIQELKGGETGARMQEAIQSVIALAEAPDDYKIIVFSDRYEARLYDLAGKHRLEFWLVGQQKKNVAVTALDIYQGLYDYSQRQAYITLRNFSDQPLKTGLKIYLDQTLQWENDISLSAGGSRTLPFGKVNQPGIMKAELTSTDALMSDNTAYALISPDRLTNLLLITSDQKLAAQLNRLTETIPGLKLMIYRPEQFDPSLVKQFDMAIFHHLVPKPLPHINALYIMPSPGNPAFPVTQSLLDKPRIMDWNRRHPVLRYLNFLEEIPLRKAQVLEPPVWADVLMETQKSPLAWEGEYLGRRLICLGFELGDYLFSASQDVSMSVLLLNILDWLSPLSAASPQIKTGEEFILRHPVPIKQASIKNPPGERIELSAGQSTITFSDTDYVGVYELSAVDVLGENIKQRFVANLLDEEESDISPSSEQAPKPADSSIERTISKQQLELWRYVVLAGLLFLLVEWWVYFRKFA
jgi:hypothetical protein